jgi:hypothetical protein
VLRKRNRVSVAEITVNCGSKKRNPVSVYPVSVSRGDRYFIGKIGDRYFTSEIGDRYFICEKGDRYFIFAQINRVSVPISGKRTLCSKSLSPRNYIRNYPVFMVNLKRYFP